MVDTQLLENAISTSGKTKTHLAKAIGCTIQSFRLRCINKYDFRSNEVAILCDELGITRLTDKEKIFFAKNVDKKPTMQESED